MKNMKNGGKVKPYYKPSIRRKLPLFAVLYFIGKIFSAEPTNPVCYSG